MPNSAAHYCLHTLAIVAFLSVPDARAQVSAPSPPNAQVSASLPASARVPGPTLAQAQKALAAAQAAAGKIGINLSCAVVDSRGDLIALQRMDKARFWTADVARGKALMSAMFGQPSGNSAPMASVPWFQNLSAAAQGRLYPVQGGLPIMRSDQVYGAIACSGGTPQQDEDSAKAGLTAF